MLSIDTMPFVWHTMVSCRKLRFPFSFAQCVAALTLTLFSGSRKYTHRPVMVTYYLLIVLVSGPFRVTSTPNLLTLSVSSILLLHGHNYQVSHDSLSNYLSNSNYFIQILVFINSKKEVSTKIQNEVNFLM